MSVYISQLPEYSGSAADLRWFIMNNSGETTTFKYSGYTSPFIVRADFNPPGLFSTFGTIPAQYTTNSKGTICIGDEAVAKGDYSVVIGWKAIGYDNPEGRGVAIGADANATALFSTGIGMSTRARGGFSTALGFNAEADTNYTVALGHKSWSRAEYGITIGGFGDNTQNFMPNSIVIGGSLNTPSSTGKYNNMFNGSGNTIGGSYSGVSMLSCFGRTANADNTTYVENIHTFRTPSTQVQSVVSGTTFTCNLNNGAKSQFYITGTSTVNITNVRDGASFMIKTQTDGNYNITWTATGYTFVFEGGLKDPGNNVTDIFVFEVFGSVIYGNRRHNYS
jgi:hypothetical protein